MHGPGWIPGEIDHDLAHAGELEQAVADAGLDAPAAGGYQEIVDRPPAMRHGDEYRNPAVTLAHVINVAEVHDVGVDLIKLLVAHFRQRFPNGRLEWSGFG